MCVCVCVCVCVCTFIGAWDQFCYYFLQSKDIKDRKAVDYSSLSGVYFLIINILSFSLQREMS